MSSDFILAAFLFHSLRRLTDKLVGAFLSIYSSKVRGVVWYCFLSQRSTSNWATPNRSLSSTPTVIPHTWQNVATLANCEPQLEQNMPNTNSPLRRNVQECRDRSLPHMVRAHDVCLQRWFFVCSASILFWASPLWAIVLNYLCVNCKF